MTATSVFYSECQIVEVVLITSVYHEIKPQNSHKHFLVLEPIKLPTSVSGVQPSKPLFTHNLGLPPPALLVVAQPFPSSTMEGNGEGEEEVGIESEMNITYHF